MLPRFTEKFENVVLDDTVGSETTAVTSAVEVSSASEDCVASNETLKFDADFYRAQNNDLTKLDMQELKEHWENQGQEEGRAGNAEERLQQVLAAEVSLKEFDVDQYINLNPDLKHAFEYHFEAVEHYLNVGRHEKRQFKSDQISRSVFFNSEFYGSYYEDLRTKREEELVSHWRSQGRKEGRFGSAEHALAVLQSDEKLPADFDVKHYLSLNEDLIETTNYPHEAVDHYLRFGYLENRFYLSGQESAEADIQIKDEVFSIADLEGFDPVFYKTNYSDLANLSIQELKSHWVYQGKNEGRYFSEEHALSELLSDPELPEKFIVEEYLRLNPDLQDSTQWKYQAVHHYLKFGAAENRRYSETKQMALVTPKYKFDASFYRAFYADIQGMSDEECYEHFLNMGVNEGRKCNFDEYLDFLSDDVELTERFNLPTYIRKNPDLIGHFDHKWDYYRHYLHTGREERRSYVADNIDAKFILGYYGLEVDKTLSPSEVLIKLRRQLRADRSEPIFLNELELVNFYGFKYVEFLGVFDHETYVYANADLAKTLASVSRARCLEHFVVEGYKHCPLINYNYRFDPCFYGNEYRDSLMHLVRDEDYDSLDVWEIPAVSARIYEHWVRFGLHEHKFASISNYVVSKFGVELPEQVQEEVGFYQLLSPELIDDKRPSSVFMSFISHGIEEGRFQESHSAETCVFYCAIARSFAQRQQSHIAVRLYEKILTNVPDYPLAMHQLGDELLKSKFYQKAIDCYQSLVDTGTATEWVYLNLAECYKHLSEYSAAAKVLKRASDVYPADIYINERASDLITEQFDKALDRSRHLVKMKKVTLGRDLINDALSNFDVTRIDELVARDTNQIAIIGNHDLPQCRFYRIDQKTELLTRAGYSVDVFKHTENLDKFYAKLHTYEAVIFYRVPSIPNIVDAINATNVEGIPSIYDVDDLIFDPMHFPPALKTYAGQIDETVHGHLTVDTPLVEHAIKMCEYGIASTSSLANHMSRYVRSKSVEVLRNGLSAIHLKNSRLCDSEPVVKDESAPVTIFYGSGTKAHKNDFHDIVEPVFERLNQNYGDKVRFLVMGHVQMTDVLKSLGNALTLLEPVADIETFWDILRYEADVNLAVLSSNDVTDTKSEIKWLEASMFGLPSVVSSTTTYQEVVEHGKTGFVCDDVDAFYQSLELLVESKDLRKSIGDQAKEAALTNYGIESQSEALKSIIDSFKANAKSKKTKIAIVNVFYPPEAIGGATRVVHDNVLELKARHGDSLDIQVFCTSAGAEPYATKQYEQDGVKVTAVSCPAIRDIDTNLTDVNMGLAFNRFLKSFQPDLVHFHCIQRLTESIVSEARHLSIPYVITAHDGWWVSDKQFLIDSDDQIKLYSYDLNTLSSAKSDSIRQKKLQREVFGAKKVLTVSKPFQFLYESAGLGNVITIENGVSGLTRTKRKPSDNGKVRLAHIGGMERHKGLHLLQNALMSSPQIKNLELLVIDHAAPFGSIRKELWGATEVTFKPKTLQSEVAKLYSEVDVLVAPSVWPESYGLVTREALFCGCWVIASDRGAIGESVEHGKNGFIVSVDDISNLRKCLSDMDENPELFLETPSNELALRHSYEQADDLFELYKEIVDETEESLVVNAA